MLADTTVLAVYDRWVIEAILRHPKGGWLLIHECMKEVDAAELSRTKCDFVAVFIAGIHHFYPSEFANKLFEQTKNCSSAVKERWTY
jgi:hypothetical protein